MSIEFIDGNVEESPRSETVTRSDNGNTNRHLYDGSQEAQNISRLLKDAEKTESGRRSLFSWYFDDPMMTATSIRGSPAQSFVTRLVSGLRDGSTRAVFAVLPAGASVDGRIAEERRMSTLPWVSLHMVSFADERYVHLPKHSYSVKSRLNIPIVRKDRSGEKSTYTVAGHEHITVVLPHTKKDVEYSEEGTLVAAIETFNTIINVRNAGNNRVPARSLRSAEDVPQVSWAGAPGTAAGGGVLSRGRWTEPSYTIL